MTNLNGDSVAEPIAGDGLVFVMLNELHANMPEVTRPMSRSDLSDEQYARARKAVHAVLTEWQSACADLRRAQANGDSDELVEAVKPWANYHGDLPDYDHPLRPVFESGIQYAVELLAKVLKVEDWEICDGTEEFDGDLGGTLLNIVIKTWPTDEHGDWIDFRDPETRAALTASNHAELSERVRVLEAENEQLREGIKNITSRGHALLTDKGDV